MSSEVKSGFIMGSLQSVGRSLKELLGGFIDTLGYVFAADLYEYARLAMTEHQGDLNPLGRLSERY